MNSKELASYSINESAPCCIIKGRM